MKLSYRLVNKFKVPEIIKTNFSQGKTNNEIEA